MNVCICMYACMYMCMCVCRNILMYTRVWYSECQRNLLTLPFLTPHKHAHACACMSVRMYTTLCMYASVCTHVYQFPHTHPTTHSNNLNWYRRIVVFIPCLLWLSQSRSLHHIKDKSHFTYANGSHHRGRDTCKHANPSWTVYLFISCWLEKTYVFSLEYTYLFSLIGIHIFIPVGPSVHGRRLADHMMWDCKEGVSNVHFFTIN